MTTLKAAGERLAGLVEYYAGLAERTDLDTPSRGPVDYYLDPDEPPGRWWGAGAAAIGLRGEVDPGQLRRMLEARHPIKGSPVGRGFVDRSARAFDATFSAPKSVSVLWALSDDPWLRAEVLAAHDAAVMAALDWLERHGAVTRRGKDGVDQVDTHGLTAALFRQHTSRTADPQLHTHAVVWSKIQDPSGAWLALDARWLKYQQRAIGWVYDAALRTEIARRLGATWGLVVEGHADLDGMPRGLLDLYSQRSDQVDAKLAELVQRWAGDHDGMDPDPRTIARLQRAAVLASRPSKLAMSPAATLRAEWIDRADAAGFDLADLPRARQASPLVTIDEDLVIAQAVERVAGQSATWLRADLGREIAALLPPDVAADGAALVTLVDDLVESAAARCLELHPMSTTTEARRGDGRPLREHVVNRRLTSHAVLGQEAELIRWAELATRPPDPALAPAEVVSGHDRLVLVVGPAGAGKTTMLETAVRRLGDQGRHVLGLAPSGKAADVLATEAGCATMTVAKLLEPHTATPPPGTTVIVDEAGMASTDDLARLVALTERHGWRLVCVGDPEQLPAVGRGGMFAHWCDTLPALHLDRVHRFVETWEAEASLQLRAGDRRAVERYVAHGRLESIHSALLPRQIAADHERLGTDGSTVAITTSSAASARAINVAIQRRRRGDRTDRVMALRDGTHVGVGDRVVTRRNDPNLRTTHGIQVRNRQTWSVVDVRRDGGLTVVDPDRGRVELPGDYVCVNVELGWAVTGYGNQGDTVDHGIAVIEAPSSRAGAYVAMTRGRRDNVAWVLDDSGLEDPGDVLASIIARPSNGITAHAMRDRLARDLGVEPPRCAQPRSVEPPGLSLGL